MVVITVSAKQAGEDEIAISTLTNVAKVCIPLTYLLTYSLGDPIFEMSYAYGTRARILYKQTESCAIWHRLIDVIFKKQIFGCQKFLEMHRPCLCFYLFIAD